MSLPISCLSRDTCSRVVGVPLATPAGGCTASTLAQAIGGVQTILAWDPSTQGFVKWAPESHPVSDFTVDSTAGYVVRVSTAIAGFTP